MLYSIITLLFVSSIGYAEPARQDTVTRYYSISPTAFVPEYDLQTYLRAHGYLLSTSTNENFFVPVYLPDSARVIEFKAWVRDSCLTNNITVRLIRGQIHTAVVYPMATASSVAGAGDQELTDTEIEYSIIDNALYTYSAEVHLWAPDYRHALYGMRIKYEVVQGGTEVAETSDGMEHAPIKGIYPTPFAHETTIKYAVPKTNKVTIKIYDEAGRLVKTLIDETMNSGSYTARWDGKDDNGRKVAGGSYFCIIKTNGSSSTKMVYIK